MTGPNGSVGGGNNVGGVNKVLRSQSDPNLAGLAAQESLDALRHGLRHLSDVDPHQSSGGHSSDGPPQGSGGNSQRRHSDSDVMGRHSPSGVVSFPPSGSGSETDMRQHFDGGVGDNPAQWNFPPGTHVQGEAFMTPVKGTQSQAVGGTSPLRTSALSNRQTIAIKGEIKAALNAAFEPSNATHSAGISSAGFSSFLAAPYSKSLSPAQIASSMATVYSNQSGENLDVFLEAFGEVLAEKGTANPEVFHAFFQKNLGSSLFHRESMISRFSNGFEHRLKGVENLRVSHNPLDASTAKMKILHANIGGGDSCMQSLGKTLLAVASSLTGNIDGEDPRLRLIQDIADILMSETNRGVSSDQNSGISTLRNALFASPNLAGVLAYTPAGTIIADVLETEYKTQNQGLGPKVRIENLADPETPFYDALKLATVLDILSPVPDSCGLTACVMHQLDRTVIKADEPIPTREASIFLRVKFPDMPTDFSEVHTRAELDDSEVHFHQALSETVDMVCAANYRTFEGHQELKENLLEILSLVFRTANEDSRAISAKKSERLQELQAAFTTKLTAGIVPPTTADSGQWQIAANALRELNAAFVDLYRPEEAGYEGTKAALTNLATGVMAGYRQLAGSGLQTDRNPPINGTHDANLMEIDRRLDAYSNHQTEFNRIFAAGEGPMGDVRTAQNGEIQRPIDVLLTRKVEVADAKLNAATDTLKGALKALYIALGKDQATVLEDATAEATRRKIVASAHINTADGLNTQANTTSEAADTLNTQSRDIHNLARAYASAKQQIDGVIYSAGRDLNGVESTTVTEAELQTRQDALDNALTDALHRFSTSGSTDAAVATIKETLDQYKARANSNGVAVLRDFAASGIQPRQPIETDADRLAYLQTQATRLGRFLPDATHAEGNCLLESEKARLAAEQSDAARAAAAAAAAAKAEVLAEIRLFKEALVTRREARDELRSRRPDGEASALGETTLRLATAFGELHDLDDTATERGISAYRDAMTAYSDAMIAEMEALQVGQASDLHQLTQMQNRHTQVLQKYSSEIAQPFVFPSDVTNLGDTLRGQGDKPHATTISGFQNALQADIQAMKSSHTAYTQGRDTANRNFDSAVQTLTTVLSSFYTTIGVADTSSADAGRKADTAKRDERVADDLRLDVQTTRMDAATGRLTGETGQIRQLITHYKTAQNAIAENTRTNWAQESLSAKLQDVLNTFDAQTKTLPATEASAARLSLQRAIETAQRDSDAARAVLDEIDTPAPAKAKPKPPQNPVDPNIAIRSAQLAALKGVTENLTASLNALAQKGSLDAFQAALTTGLQTLRDAAADAPLVPSDSKVKKAFDALLASVTTAQFMGEVLISARPKDEKLETLRAWQKACQPVVESLNKIPQAWKNPLTIELKKYQTLRTAKEAALKSTNDTLQKRLDTLASTLQAGGVSADAAKDSALQTLIKARAQTPDDVLAAAENAIPIMDEAIAVATENNRIAAEAAAMAIATQRLQTVTQNIRAEYAGDPAQDTRVTDEVDNAQAQVVTRFGDGPATSASTTAKAQILEARLADIRETKRSVALAAAQALMATARQGVSDATAVLGDRLSAWASVAGLAVPTTEMIVADMVTKLFSGRSKESLSPEELDTLCQHIDLRSAAYQDITDAANGAVKAYGYLDLARGVIADAIYGGTHVPTKPAKSIVATDKLHAAAKTLRARTAETQQATAASRLRTAELQNLENTKTKLGQVLARNTNSMAERRALLQEAVGLLGTISTETNRLFPDDTAKEGRAAHTAFKGMSRQVQTTYSRFCKTDSQDLLSQSTGTLGSVGTASSSGLAGVANGLRDGHTVRRNEFNTAYTIDGLSSAPRDAGLATLDGFAGQLSGAVVGRRGQLDSIRRAYVAANNQLAAAFGDAQRDIDFKKTTASELNAKTRAFTTACEAAELGMNTVLRNIPPDADQPQVFGRAVTTAHEKLKAAFTTGVSTRLQTDIRSFDELIADMDIYTTEDTSTYTALAFRLRARATDLRDFMTAGLGDEINTITQRHFDQVLATANEAATQAIARATVALTDGIDPDTISPRDLSRRMQQFDLALNAALASFTSDIQDLPVGENITDALSTLTARVKQLGPIAKRELISIVSAPLETQRQSIATLLTHEGVTLADLNAVQGQVDRLDQRSAALGNAWVSNMTEIDQTLSAYAAKLGILKGTRNSQILALTAAMNALTFIPKPNPFGMNLDDKWSAIRDHEGQFKKLNQDYHHLLEEEDIDPRITDAKEACILRATAARENLVPEKDTILSAIPALLTTLPADFDWDTTLESLANGISLDPEIINALKAAGQAIPGLDAAIRSRLIARETVETAKSALIAWRPGQPLEMVSTHQANVLFLAFPAVPFDATAFDSALKMQTMGVDTHARVIQTLATPVSETSLKSRWQQIDRYEAALGGLGALDPFENNGALQGQISDIKTHLNGYAMPSAVEKETFHGSLNASLSDETLMTSEAIMGEALFLSLELGGSGNLKIQSPKFAVAIQAAAAEAASLAPDVLSRITYRTHVIAAERLLMTMGNPEQGIAELETTLTNLAAKPAENTIFASHDRAQSRRAEAAKVAIMDRIAELKAHAQRLIAAVDTANIALDTARRTAETLPRQVGTETADTLNARMTALDRAANAALAAFDTAVVGLPDNQARREARDALVLRMSELAAPTKTTLLEAVSAPLTPENARLEDLVNDPATTLETLQNEHRAITELQTRRGALGDTWLTDNLGATIDRTIAAYDLRVDALRTRQGQLRLLTDAIDGIRFAGGATMVDKWAEIRTQQAAYDTLLAHEDYRAIMAERPIDLMLTEAQTTFTDRLQEAKADTAAERATLITHLSAQLNTLATGFDWNATLTTAETAALNTLPADLRANAEMSAALTAAKGGLAGLQNAVTTRVAARAALDTARASLTGWPASGRSLNDIRTEVETARTTFGNREWTVLLEEWDLATGARVETLERDLADSILRRDALIAQFQAITTMAVRTDTLANRWTDIAAKETTLATLQTTAANIPMLVDPQVAAKIAEVREALNGNNAPTDLERAAFTVGMNTALLATPALGNSAEVLDSAVASVNSGLPAGSAALVRFNEAVAAVRAENIANEEAITQRITYRSNIVTAQGVLEQVQTRTTTGANLEAAIGRIGAVPAIVDPGDGTNIFATADAAMATQRATVERGLVTHRALVTAFTNAITIATGQLPTIDGTTTAQAKWTALIAAKDTYTNGKTAAQYLFGATDPTIHPDIVAPYQSFTVQFNARGINIAPEARDIRRAAAERLTLCLTDDSHPIPVFNHLRNEVLNASVPATYQSDMSDALDTASRGEIEEEIQTRMELHAALQALEADITSSPITKKIAIDAAKALFQNRPLNPAYAACDAILLDRLQALQRGVYGVLAEETAQAMLGKATTLHITEAKKAGTTSSLIQMGALWQNLESEFRNSAKGPGWKYDVSLDDAFQWILDPSTPPKDTDEFIGFLRTSIERLNLQAGPAGLPDPYQRIAETALQRLEGRNTGTPQLCAWAMSANLRLVMSVIENFGDTRAAVVYNGMGGNRMSLHEGITLKKQDATSLTGYSRDHGALWSTLHQQPIDFMPIQNIAAENIPGFHISEAQFCELIEKIGTPDSRGLTAISGYIPAGIDEASLTKAGRDAFFAIITRDGDMLAFLELGFPNDGSLSVRECYRRWEALLKNETEYKHLRYLFGRKFERVYQELVLENV